MPNQAAFSCQYRSGIYWLRLQEDDGGLPVYQNLLKNIKITGLNQAWVSDITYVQLLHEHIYLAVILDLYSRKCIGWELSRNIDQPTGYECSGKGIR